MRFRLLCFAAVLTLCSIGPEPANGQSSPAPVIFQGGIVNAASFLPVGLPGSGIAPGSIFSIFGDNLGPDPGLSAGEFPLSSSLGGVSVEIRSATGETLAAWPLFVSRGQINAILPSRTPAGQSRVTVFWEGRGSQPVAVKIVRSSFGVFTRNLGGVEAAVAQKFVSEANRPLQSLTEPARPGQTLTLWGTGLGPIASPDFMPPPAGSLETPIEVRVGNRPASIAYHGRSPCCAGVDQINIRVPDDAPMGCFVPLSVQVQGVLYSNVATIAVAPPGEPCGRPEPNLLSDSLAGPRAWILLRRKEVRPSGQPTPNTGTMDLAEAFFWGPSDATPEADLDAQLRVALAEAGHAAVLPPDGTCLPLTPPAAAPDAPRLRLLDAGGEVLLRGPAGETALPREADSYRAAAPPEPLFLGPGSYRVEGAGGSEFPPFVAAVQAAQAPVRFSEFAVNAASRLAGFTLAWMDADPFWKSILVWSQPPDAHRPGSPNLVCRVSPEAGSFTVPASALANLSSAAARLRFGGRSAPTSLQVAGASAAGHLLYQQETEWTVDFGRPHLPSTPLRLPNGVVIQAELATSGSEWARGLMHRPLLPPDQGMLFLFEIPGRYPFFMLNTLIPLDIIWLDSDRRVVFLSEHTPPCPPEQPICPTFGGSVTAQFVVELAAGQAEANGLAIGDQLDW